MEDKEVGELWRTRANRVFADDVKALIRKLVEERAWWIAKDYYRASHIERAEMLSCVKAALRDFGIDPETWEKHGN